MARPFQREDASPTRVLTVQLVPELFEGIAAEARARKLSKHGIHKALLALALAVAKKDPSLLDPLVGRY